MAKLFTAAKSYGHAISKIAKAADMVSTANFSLFVIEGGPIRVHTLGLVITTELPAGANTLKFRFTPYGGSITDLSGTTDTASATAMQMFLLEGTKATGPTKTTDVGILAAGQSLSMTNIILTQGHIYAVFSAGPPATGEGIFFMEYSPCSHFTKVHVE